MGSSGFFADTRQAAQVMVKILAGQELGLVAFASMTRVPIIQNKPVLSANRMAGAVKRSVKYTYRVVTLDDSQGELAFYEGATEVGGRSRFTMGDAQAAELPGKDIWRASMGPRFTERGIRLHSNA